MEMSVKLMFLMDLNNLLYHLVTRFRKHNGSCCTAELKLKIAKEFQFKTFKISLSIAMLVQTSSMHCSRSKTKTSHLTSAKSDLIKFKSS